MTPSLLWVSPWVFCFFFFHGSGNTSAHAGLASVPSLQRKGLFLVHVRIPPVLNWPGENTQLLHTDSRLVFCMSVKGFDPCTDLARLS